MNEILNVCTTSIFYIFYIDCSARLLKFQQKIIFTSLLFCTPCIFLHIFNSHGNTTFFVLIAAALVHTNNHSLFLLIKTNLKAPTLLIILIMKDDSHYKAKSHYDKPLPKHLVMHIYT